MKDLPYFRWWVARADTDESYSSMTDQELGFYHRCLNKSWVNTGLPSDLDKLARLMKVTRDYLDSVWGEVGKCWFVEGDRLFNRTQEEERTWATGKSAKASSSVRSRYERSNERSTNDLLRALGRADSDSDSSSKQFEVPENPTGPNVIFPMTWEEDEQYGLFVADYLGTGASLIGEDFAEAWKWCWRTLDFEQRLERIAGLNKHAEEYRADPRFVPHPRKFLETEWKREPKPLRATAPKALSPTQQALQRARENERRNAK